MLNADDIAGDGVGLSGQPRVRVLDVLRASGERDLGAGLLRLARLAAAAHAAAAAGEGVGEDHVGSGRANGVARGSGLAGVLHAAGPAHKEVGR